MVKYLQSITIAIIFLVLSACANHPLDCATDFIPHDDCLPGTAGYESAQKRAALAATMVELHKQNDDKTCKSYGLKFGTAAYAQCRQQMLALRVDQGIAAENNQAMIKAQAATAIIQNQNKPTSPPVYQMPVSTRTSCTKYGNSIDCTTH